MSCPTCLRDPKAVELREADSKEGPLYYQVSGHACHCVRDGGARVAVGICCGRMLGPELIRAEEEADARRRAEKR